MSFAGFLAVLIVAPLAFGSTESWSVTATELLVSLTALLCFFPFRKAAFYQIPGIIPLLLLLGWMFFQTLPVPLALIRLLSPGTAAIYQPVLALLPQEAWLPLTVNRQATLLEGLRFSSYALFYILTVQLLSRRERLTRTVSSVAWLTLFIAFATMLQQATAPHTLFWLRTMQSGLGSFGPWVYKNHYAGFMVMTCPLVLASFLLHRPLAEEGASFRERLLRFFSGADTGQHLWFGFGTIVIIASVLLAQSRGGILSLAFTLLVFFLLLARKQGQRPTLTILALCGGLLLAGSWYNWTALLERFQYMVDTATGGIRDDRLLIWRDCFRLIADFPFTGTGFGTFPDVFPSYKTLADVLIYDHAHNDYLELLADGGIVSFLLAAWFAGAVLRRGWQQIFRRHDQRAVLLSIGAFSGLAGLLFFSLTDFNLHNWANGLYFFFLCGLLTAAGHTRWHYRHRPTLLVPMAFPVTARTAAFVIAALLLLAGLRLHGGELRADQEYRQAQSIAASSREQGSKLAAMQELLEQAAANAPFNGGYRYALANINAYQQHHEAAFQLYLEAALRQPLEKEYLRAAKHTRRKLRQTQR